MQRAEEKTRVNTSKLAEFERQHDEHEAGRKAAEVRCQENIQIVDCLYALRPRQKLKSVFCTKNTLELDI